MGSQLFSLVPPTSSKHINMKTFLVFCLVAAVTANPALRKERRPRQDGGYIAPAASYEPEAQASEVVSTKVAAEPIAIVRSVFETPEPAEFRSSFEGENGIKQEMNGELRLVGDSEVVVMRGSYEYIGADGVTYVVDWIADENGFQPSAPHLPESVVPNHPEVRAAVAAQLAFAAEEDAAAAASSRSESYAAPPTYNSSY